jgi:hypothetical protein
MTQMDHFSTTSYSCEVLGLVTPKGGWVLIHRTRRKTADRVGESGMYQKGRFLIHPKNFVLRERVAASPSSRKLDITSML